MQGFDRDLAMLRDTYGKTGVLDNTLFILMSDHGMMPLVHTVSKSDFTATVSRAGTSVAAEAYTSGIYLWVKDESRAPRAAMNIAALGNPHIQATYVRTGGGSAYRYVRVSGSNPVQGTQLEAANQYLLNSFNGVNAPDIVVVLKEGVGCEPDGQSHWKADHGGTSWQAQHIPLILSGPGIRSGHVSSSPARLIDVAPTVLQMLGASYSGMQGTPLADAMTSPPRWAIQAQQATNAKLLPVVKALQQQSRNELAVRS